MERGRALSAAPDRAGAGAVAGAGGADLERCRAVRAVRAVGAVVAAGAAFDGAGRAGVVRAAMPGGHHHRSGQQPQPRPWHPAVDALERLAVRGVRRHHRLWPDDQRLSLSEFGAADPWRFHFGGDRHRPVMGPQQAGVVPLPLSGEWRVRRAGQAGAAAFPGRQRRLGPLEQAARCDAGGELRAAGADAHYEGRQRLPYVRALQLLSRRDHAGAALAEPRDRRGRRRRAKTGRNRADPVRPARHCRGRVPLAG